MYAAWSAHIMVIVLILHLLIPLVHFQTFSSALLYEGPSDSILSRYSN